MVKSLVNKLKGGFKKAKQGLKKAVLGGIAFSAIGLASCCIISPGSPEAILDVNPVYGQAPLEVSISLDGIDDKKEITEYKIEIDKGCDKTIDEIITQEKPIYIKRTFNEDAFVYGQVKNSCDNTDRKKETIDVYHLNEEDGTPNNQPEITSSPVKEVNEGQGYYYDVDAEDADGDTLEYSLAPGSADWLSIDSQTGEITGTAPATSSDIQENVVVKVYDGKDETLHEYVLNVYNLLDISGRLQDNESDSNQGKFRKLCKNLYN